MKNKGFPKEYYLVNDILKEWNPIGVDEPSLTDEYIGYIPSIMKVRNDFDKLIEYLEHMLINEIGVSYNSSNKKHKNDLISFAKRLYEIKV
jgi:hypothetical protein